MRMRDDTLSPVVRPVTHLASRRRPDLLPSRPQGVEGLVWDALVCEARPVQVKDVAHLTDLSRCQVTKALQRLKQRGVVDGYRVPGYPSGWRMAYHLADV